MNTFGNRFIMWLYSFIHTHTHTHTLTCCRLQQRVSEDSAAVQNEGPLRTRTRVWSSCQRKISVSAQPYVGLFVFMQLLATIIFLHNFHCLLSHFVFTELTQKWRIYTLKTLQYRDVRFIHVLILNYSINSFMRKF